MKLVGIVGTNADFSLNRILLQHIAKEYSDKVELELLEVREVPLFDRPSDKDLPEAVKDIEAKIEEAEGVIFATPEYNHSIPAVLNALVEWLSFSSKKVLENKATLVVGASYGLLGSTRAQQNMRNILHAPEVKAVTMPGQEYLLGHAGEAFDDNGYLVYEDKRTELDQLMNDFTSFANLYNETHKQISRGEGK